MGRIDVLEYSFVNEIAPALRRGSEQIREAYSLFDTKVDIETIKAFLIHLTISTFGRSKESDIVLMSWGLLKGYEDLPTVTARRIKYMTESGYKSKSKTVSTRTPEAKSKDFIRKEDKLYEKLYQTFTDHRNNTEFLKAARELYSEPVPGEPKTYRVKLPDPSYVNKNPAESETRSESAFGFINPGEISEKTRQILESLDNETLDAFLSLNKAILYEIGANEDEPFLCDTSGMSRNINREYNLGLTELRLLIEGGLLLPKESHDLPLRYTCSAPKYQAILTNRNERFVIRITSETEFKVPLDVYPLTRAGKELLPFLPKHNDLYLIEAGQMIANHEVNRFNVGVYKVICDFYPGPNPTINEFTGKDYSHGRVIPAGNSMIRHFVREPDNPIYPANFLDLSTNYAAVSYIDEE